MLWICKEICMYVCMYSMYSMYVCMYALSPRWIEKLLERSRPWRVLSIFLDVVQKVNHILRSFAHIYADDSAHLHTYIHLVIHLGIHDWRETVKIRYTYIYSNTYIQTERKPPIHKNTYIHPYMLTCMHTHIHPYIHTHIVTLADTIITYSAYVLYILDTHNKNKQFLITEVRAFSVYKQRV